MVYWDDKGNIAIINTYAIDAASDVSISIDGNYEESLTANDVSDMVGSAVIGGGSVQILGTDFGVGYGHSMSFGDGSIKSNTISGSGGVGLSPLPVSVNGGVAYSIPVLQFNAKDWLEQYLDVK